MWEIRELTIDFHIGKVSCVQALFLETDYPTPSVHIQLCTVVNWIRNRKHLKIHIILKQPLKILDKIFHITLLIFSTDIT